MLKIKCNERVYYILVNTIHTYVSLFQANAEFVLEVKWKHTVQLQCNS